MRTNFWATDLDLAAQVCKDRHPREVEQTLKLADEACNNSFTLRGHWEMERTHVPVVFEKEIRWDEIHFDDPEWVYAFNRHSYFVVLGKAWRYTQDVRYPLAFARLIEDWIDRAPLTEQSKNTTWRSIETGLRCETWLRALALFENSGVPDARLQKKIEDSLLVHAQWLLEAHKPFQKLSNWGVLQDHGLLLLGLAFGKNEWCDIAASRLTEELYHQVMADGTHWEQSPLYHCEVLHCCLDSILACKRAGYALPAQFMQKTKEMSLALAYMVRPDGKLICQSDSDEVDARDLIALAALMFGSQTLWAYAGDQLAEENIWDFVDETAEFSSLPAGDERKGSIALPDSGNYMLWGGSGNEADFLHFHCGCLGSGHGHADLLHVDLISRGETILADSGRYTYVDTPLRRQLKAPAAHNIIKVDGLDFSEAKDSWGYTYLAESLKGSYTFTPEADYVEGAHLGYLKQGVLPRRRVLRLGNALWVLYDSMVPTDDKEHIYEHYFHFGADGAVTLQKEGNTAFYKGQKASAKVIFSGTSLAYAASREPLSREYNKLEESDCLCVSHNAKGFTSMATVIATGAPSEAIDLKIERIPVILHTAKTILPAEKAEALQIRLNDKVWTVILCNNEVIAEVDMLEAGECIGYGKVLVLAPGDDKVQCLLW